MPHVEGELADDREYPAPDDLGQTDVTIPARFPPARPVEDHGAPYEFMAEIERAEQQVRIVQSRPQPLIGEPPTADQIGRASYTDLPVLVCGPADHVLINLGPDTDRRTCEELKARISEQWPDVADRVMVAAVTQIVVIEA